MKYFKFLLLILIIFFKSNFAFGYTAKLRVAGRTVSDSYNFNYEMKPGDTIDLGIWLNSDTEVNGFSAYLHFDTNIIALQDLISGTSGIQLSEDTASFGNIFTNISDNDTIDYSALSNASYFTGDTRVAYMRIYAKKIGETIALIWDFDTSVNRVTEMDTAGTNVLTGVDTVYIYVRPDSVQNLKSSVDITAPGTGCVLVWSPATDTGVKGYLVYRATSDRNYSLVSPLVTGTTTYEDSSAIFGQTYFWAVTATDTDIPARSESVYSDSTTAPHLKITKSITKIQLGSNDTKPIPGSSFRYSIIMQSNGFDAADSVVIDDEIDTRYLVFDTNIAIPQGWTQLFAHKDNPDLSYNSADFDTIYQNVRWLRFTKSFVAIGDSATFQMKLFLK